ncbi:hypothetical protein EV284_6407 [Streptomyces sp. BK022]|uniref:hypothetical protein n=1 Tax=Streptomyces sp. BK022 TaxID=2512123 RepID=UPI00102A5CA5|nr:hypothetical protein [Streptomyces sp. BK022]RZU28241.1 hypothetical protein EV284_6407 [Streptomyces sp. BK022]
MTTSTPAGPTTPASVPPCPALTLADRVAALLPARDGELWAVQPYRAWWTVQPAARLVQGGRALILSWHPWSTGVAWQLPDREPYQPDAKTDEIGARHVADVLLRHVLPAVDDELAGRDTRDGAEVRRERLARIGHVMRRQGVATLEQAGPLESAAHCTWGTPSGLRYTLTLFGTNPAGHLTVEGPVAAVEATLATFLPARQDKTPRIPLRHVRGRMQRRMAAFLARHTDVEQVDSGALAFGSGDTPYGFVATPTDPVARVRDTSPVTVELHGLGADLLAYLAPQLTR